MLQIKKVTTALIDIDVERARIMHALPSRTQTDVRNALIGILTYVERFDVKSAAGLFDQLNDECKKLLNPYIAEMLADYRITSRLRATPYATTAPRYEIMPADANFKRRYHS